jgi:hypothetical protein
LGNFGIGKLGNLLFVVKSSKSGRILLFEDLA